MRVSRETPVPLFPLASLSPDPLVPLPPVPLVPFPPVRLVPLPPVSPVSLPPLPLVPLSPLPFPLSLLPFLWLLPRASSCFLIVDVLLFYCHVIAFGLRFYYFLIIVLFPCYCFLAIFLSFSYEFLTSICFPYHIGCARALGHARAQFPYDFLIVFFDLLTIF